MLDKLLPSLLAKIDPGARRHIAAVAELAGCAGDLGPEPLPEVYAGLYDHAERLHQLPPDLLAAAYIVADPEAPKRIGSDRGEAAAFLESVSETAAELAAQMREHGIGVSLLWLAAKLCPDGPVKEVAGRIAGVWQILTARRMDPSSARTLASWFRPN